MASDVVEGKRVGVMGCDEGDCGLVDVTMLRPGVGPFRGHSGTTGATPRQLQTLQRSRARTGCPDPPTLLARRHIGY